MKPQSILFLEEWMKSAKRLTASSGEHGGREPAIMAWLADFAQLSLEELSEGQKGDKAWELARFSYDGGLGPPFDNLSSDRKDFGIKSSTIGALSLDNLTRIQKMVRTALNAFIDNGSADFPPIEGSFTVTNSRIDEPGRVEFEGNMEATICFIMAQLLAHYGGRLRRCLWCHRITLVSRQDKTYCSQACQIARWKRDNPKKPKGEIKNKPFKKKTTKGASRHGKKNR
jgi:hypothetical protein